MRGVLSLLLPVLGGIAAGVVSSVIMQRARHRDAAGRAGPGDRPAAAIEGQVVLASSGPDGLRERLRQSRIEAVERRMQDLEASQPARAPDRDVSQQSDPRWIAEENQRLQTRHDQAIERHQNEPVDLPWARGTDQELRQGLAALVSAGGMSVADVDCRTSSCLAVVEWPSYDDAAQSCGSILNGELTVNCEREVLLPEPAPSASRAPYRATVVFENCVRGR